MASTLNATDRYLEALSEALEALGPDEAREVVAEIRSLLADAATDGNESAALAGLGSPDAFAQRILEERGILSGESSVPEASLALKAVAYAIDVALSLLVLMLVLVPLYLLPAVPADDLGSAGPAGPFDIFVTASAWLAIVVILGTLTWWWVKKRREPRHISIGMKATGIRRIRVGGRTRTVRTRDIPGLGGGRRLAPAVISVLALLVLTLFLYSVGYSIQHNIESNKQMQTERAVQETSLGAAVVTEVYRQVTTGAEVSTLTGGFRGPAATAELQALVQRYAAGEVTSYALGFVELPDDAAAVANRIDPLGDITVLVEVLEYGETSDVPVSYVYEVRTVWVSDEGGASSGQTFIESVTRGDDFEP